MKGRLIIWLILCIIMMPGSAQELKVEWMKQRPLTDMSAATNSRKDRNGQDCAVVKVLFPKQGLKFEGNVIGDTPFQDGEYWVYMPEDSKYLRVKHSDFTPLMITFEKEGINQIISKGVYELKLIGSSSEELFPVKFRVYPEDALLIVDQTERDLINGIADLQLPAGEHTYNVIKPGYYTQGNKFAVYPNNTNKIIIELDQKTSPSNQTQNTATSPSTTIAPSNSPTSTPVPVQTPEVIPQKDEQSIVEEMEKAYKANDYSKAYEFALLIPENSYAQFTLGNLYEQGKGVNQDYSKALEWYLKAAKKENDDAMNNIGFMYQRGRGVPQDYSEAMKWYFAASSWGNLSAIINLGSMHYSAQDYCRAMNWYLKAADMEDTDSMYIIGTFYEEGLCVSKNLKMAKKWYKRAADLGHKEAKERLVILNK